MNRIFKIAHPIVLPVPRASGDEPALFGSVRDHMHCSPRQRG